MNSLIDYTKQILSDDGFAADSGDGEVRREDGLRGDAILGGDIRNGTHRHRLRHGVHSSTAEIRSLQHSSAVDGRNSSATGRLLDQAISVDNLQRPDTAGPHTVLQHSDFAEGSLRADCRSARFFSSRSRCGRSSSANCRGEPHESCDDRVHLTRDAMINCLKKKNSNRRAQRNF